MTDLRKVMIHNTTPLSDFLSFFDDMDKFFATDIYGGRFTPYEWWKNSDGDYVIEVALAGYSKDSINITLSGDVLDIKVKGDSREIEPNGTYKAPYRKITKASLSKRFSVPKGSEVSEATFTDGLLTVVVSPPKPTPHKIVKVDIK